MKLFAIKIVSPQQLSNPIGDSMNTLTTWYYSKNDIIFYLLSEETAE
jgi:hypothetical protein